ncbi:hypothetical protein AGMMS49990_04190 [Endomicrobiia bacterium]|nr:hypothetical protein AGMMS49990_04190 [Endomicrobiia bacterium]
MYSLKHKCDKVKVKREERKEQEKGCKLGNEEEFNELLVEYLVYYNKGPHLALNLKTPL